MAYEDAFTFDGIEPIEQRFLSKADSAAYLVIKDRNDRNHEETLDRIDLNEEELTPYLVEPGSDDDDDPDSWGSDDEDGDDYEAEDPAPREPDKLSKPEMLRAAFRWVRETAIRNTVGERCTRFRVKLYGPKAVQCLSTGQFVCRNDNYDLGDDEDPDEKIPEMRIPPPTFEEADRHGSVRGLKALGDYYAQWGVPSR